MNDNPSNTLKSLFIFRDGENKGFIELMKKQDLDKIYEDRYKEYLKTIVDGAIVDSVNELYNLCNHRTIDADVKALVDNLYDSIGGADE